MMKKTAFSLFLLAASLLCSCERNSGAEIFTTVTLHAVMPDGSNIVSMKISGDLPGNFLRNLNTRQEYEFPVFVNGSCTLRLLKGIYLIAFDADAVFADGTVKRVRSYSHSNPDKGAVLLDEEETVELELVVLR